VVVEVDREHEKEDKISFNRCYKKRLPAWRFVDIGGVRYTK